MATEDGVIDPKIEKPLRYAFAYAIDKDLDKARDSLDVLSEQQQVQAISYAMYAIGYVINDIFKEVDEGSSLLAREDVVPDVSPWFDVGSVDSVYAFLLACATGDLDAPPAGTAPEQVPDLAIVIGGYLLGHFRRDGMRWSDYLDRIWAHAETAPRPRGQSWQDRSCTRPVVAAQETREIQVRVAEALRVGK